MSTIERWWARGAAAVAGIGLALLVPALAWAGQSPATLAVADEVARKRPRGVGVFGGLGALCCLAVVVIIILVVVLAMRKRK